MSNYIKTGSCLCGSVSYQVTGHMNIFQYCHCSRCRKFTGSAFAPNMFVPPENFQWQKGEEHVNRYEMPDTKHFATSFCSQCGSSLPWLSQSGGVVVVPVGTLDEDPELRPIQNIFCASKAVWYTEPDTLPEYEALPVKSK